MNEWKVNQVKDSVDCHIFNVERVEKTNPAGKVGDYIKIKSPDWALAIIKTKDNKYLMTHQYRHGSDTYLTEFPCGIIEKDESPMDAAIREAEEEVCIDKSKIISIRKLYQKKTNPGFMSNTMFAYLIEIDEYYVEIFNRYNDDAQDDDEFIDLIHLDSTGVDEVMSHEDTSVMMWSAWVETKKILFKE